MVGSRNGFSKLVLAIMRGRGRVQAGSRTTLPTRLTTLNISHCITIKHSADTNTDNHTTLGNPSKKKKKNVENSTLGLTPPPMTNNVENLKKKKKLKKVLKTLQSPK